MPRKTNLERITGEEKKLTGERDNPISLPEVGSKIEGEVEITLKKWIDETREELTRHLLQTVFLFSLIVVGSLVSYAVELVELKKIITDKNELNLLHFTGLFMTASGVASVCYSILVITLSSILKNTKHLKDAWNAFKSSEHEK